MAYAMVVLLHTKPGHRDEVTQILETILPRATKEDGCLAFNVHNSSDDPDLVWLYEVFTTLEYHDEVHESYVEVKAALEQLPAHLSAPWVVFQGDQVGIL